MASRIDLHVSRIKTIDAEKTTSREGIIAELAAKLSPKSAFALAA